MLRAGLTQDGVLVDGDRIVSPTAVSLGGRGVESDQVAVACGRLDGVIAGLLFMAGMRRSEVAALRWADVSDAVGC